MAMSTSISISPTALNYDWPQFPDDHHPARHSSDLNIAPFLAPPESPPPTRHKKSFNPLAKAGSSARTLLRARSSTNLNRSRNSEVNSIADTVSSRESFDGPGPSQPPRQRTNSRTGLSTGLFHTVRKKVSQKFMKQSPNNSISEPRGDIPPVPTFHGMQSSSSSLKQSSPPPVSTTFTIGRRTNKRNGRKIQHTPLGNDSVSEFGTFSGQELVLDTDLEKMEGIVDPIVLMTGTSSRHAGTSRGSMGHSTASASPTHSDWDALHGQSSSFGTSDGGNAVNHFVGLLSYSPPHISPIFTDPFTPSTSRILATSPSSLRLSPKTLTAPSSHTRSLSSDTQRRSQGLIPPTSQPPPPPPPLAQVVADGASTLPSWNPPESWAVHEEAPAEYDDSSSEDSVLFDGAPPDADSIHGSRPPTIRQGGRKLGSRQGSDIGTFATSARASNGRVPDALGIDDDLETKSRNITGPGILQYQIRVHRVDGKIHRVKLPLTATVQDLSANLHKRIGTTRESHRLYLQERGRERLLAPVEKPALIVKRRLEQAGYEPADGLEDLGSMDISFLMKFIFKSVRLGAAEEDPPTFENFVHIDLTGRSLQTIPPILHMHATNIVSLNLSKNPLLEIPKDFVQDTENLRELRLSHMSMKKVPNSLRLITSLQRLDISCNRIVDLEDSGFDKLQLQLFKAHNNRMDRLPFFFARMQSLKFLTISNNKFDHLPAVVCEMSNLVDLDISFNMLQDLPDEITQLKQLERLIIVGNQVTRFPPACSALRSLKELDCRRNLITDLSPVIRLSRLITLRADHNSIHSLDFAFGQALEILDVSYNDITKLSVPSHNSERAEEHYSLRSLDLSHAKLSSLDDFPFHRLPLLQVLKLDYNSFRSIPDTFSMVSELREFSCSNNVLDALPVGIGQLQRLEQINVQHNNLAQIPSTIWNCASLKSFNATSNLIKGWSDYAPIDGDASEAPAGDYRKGSVAGSIIMSSPPPLAMSLEQLYLGDNQLGDDVFTPLCRLKGLLILNLCFNEIQDVPRWFFSNVTQLQELYLSGNKLSSLPTEDLHRMTELRALYLNGNKLQTLPAELGKCKALEILDAGSNLLKYNINNWEFDWNWNFNTRLKYLNFSGNKRFEIKPNRGQKAIPQPPGGLTVAEFSEFKELRDLRILGLIDVRTLFVQTIPEDTEERRVRSTPNELGRMGYGISDTLGRLDHLVMQDLVIPVFRKRSEESLFGMFGRAVPVASSGRASKFLRDEFPSTFAEELKRRKDDDDESTCHALRRSFLSLNRKLFGYIATGAGARKNSQASTSLGMSNGSSMYKVGASGIVLYIAGKKLFVANAGDALAVLSRRGSAHLISKHHHPFDRGETSRIRSAEGWVSPKGMVNDEFELSRSFGMFNLLPAVNARPDMDARELVEGDEFVILANRGIWDYVSYQTAVDIAREDRDPMLAAQKLRDFALSYGADGSTMCMIVSISDLFAMPIPEVRIPRGHQDQIADKNLIRLGREVDPPTGQVTLVFSDIRNSTHLWEVNPGMRTAIHLHNRLLRRLLRTIGGYEVKTEGDAFMVSFPSPLPAILWCLSVQTQLLMEDWPLEILESSDGKESYDSDGVLLARGLSVRMGIHVGYPNCEPDPVTRRMDYFGPMVNRTARICGSADGGQIMCSADVMKALQERVSPEGMSVGSELDPWANVVDEIRRIKYVAIAVGEKKMKGLELPELVSILYARELAGRHYLQAPTSDGKADTSSSQVPFSIAQINQFGTLCLRLEALSTRRVFRHASQRKSSKMEDEEDEDETRILYADPALLLPSIPDHAPASQLMLVLDMLTLRMENALATLALQGRGIAIDSILNSGLLYPAAA